MATIELTVAYPGREGAHSAAACDRLFPAARLDPPADVPGRGRSGRLRPCPLRRPPDRELARRARRRDARPPLRVAALDRRGGDPPGQPLSRRARAGRARADPRDPLAPGRARPVPQAHRLASARVAVAAPTTADAASIVADLGDPAVVAIASDRAARLTGSRSSTATSATIPRRTRASSRSPRTRASTAATASGGRRSRSRPTTAPGRSSMRSSLSPAMESTSTSSSRGRSPRVRSAIASTPSSAAIRSTRRSAATLKEMGGLTTALRVFGSYRPFQIAGAGVGARHPV